MLPVVSDISHGSLPQATQKVAWLGVHFLGGSNVQIDRGYKMQREKNSSLKMPTSQCVKK